MREHVFKFFCQRFCRLYVFCNFDPKRQCFDVILTWDEIKIAGWCIQRWKNSGTGGYLLWLSEVQRGPVSQSDRKVLKWLLVRLGGERNRNKEFRFRFRHCRYRNSGRKKAGKFVILWIDFREDIFPVHFYSESESNSLKSIQRVTNFSAFSLPEFMYRQCRNRNRNSLYLFRSPPKSDGS